MLEKRNRTKGFTLVEMMVVMLVVGIFLSIATPSFRSLLFNLQIRAQAESMLNGLQLARATAVQRNENVQFVMTNNAGSYSPGWTVQLENGGTVIQTRSAGESSPSLVVGVLPNNATVVTFNGMGRVVANTPASNSINTIDIDVPTSIMSAGESKDLRVRVLTGGMIKMCNPNVTDTADVTYCP